MRQSETSGSYDELVPCQIVCANTGPSFHFPAADSKIFFQHHRVEFQVMSDKDFAVQFFPQPCRKLPEIRGVFKHVKFDFVKIGSACGISSCRLYQRVKFGHCLQSGRMQRDHRYFYDVGTPIKPVRFCVHYSEERRLASQILCRLVHTL